MTTYDADLGDSDLGPALRVIMTASVSDIRMPADLLDRAVSRNRKRKARKPPERRGRRRGGRGGRGDRDRHRARPVIRPPGLQAADDWPAGPDPPPTCSTGPRPRR